MISFGGQSVRLGGRPVCGFSLGVDDSDVDSLVAAKLAEGGYSDVSAYQRAKGLAVDGVAGHDTLTAMGYGYLYDLAGQGKLKPGQTQLDTKKTPLTPEKAAQALSTGYQAIAGTAPTPEILALLIAQSASETTNWRDISNYNFAGIKASPGDKYVQAMVDGNRGNRHVYAFAAYKTPAEGAEKYISLLKAHGREPWWEGLQTGDPETYVNALVSIPGAHYFEAPTEKYLASVRAGVARFADLARQYATSNAADTFYKKAAPYDVVAQVTGKQAPSAPVKVAVNVAKTTFEEVVKAQGWVDKNKTWIAVGATVLIGSVFYAIVRPRTQES
jgi:hypothetical protein